MGRENRYESLLHLAENQAVDVLFRPGVNRVNLVLMIFRINFDESYYLWFVLFRPNFKLHST